VRVKKHTFLLEEPAVALRKLLRARVPAGGMIKEPTKAG
jgi:hypothetical protein